ncbi:DUF4179 domain-containing protein [Clostridium botulinum]|uniref:DUF4179 domain-containing protein n=1 Tax=Clostridium botulinum TaxID=1491 RepID=A0A846JPS5_CLOBO|nr:DUF4179 domain-containing protein [Clostridium botulinum]
MKNIKLDDNIIIELLNYTEPDSNYDNNYYLDKITSKRIKNKINKKLNFKKRKLKYTASILIFISISTLTLCNPAWATNIKKSIFESIMTLHSGNYAEYENYTKNIYSSTYDKGINFIINQIACDYDKIIVSYTVICDKNIEDAQGLVNANFKIDGKDIEQYQYSMDSNNNVLNEGVFKLELKNENITNKFTLEMNITSIGNLDGDWSFNLDIDKNEITNDTKEYIINKEINIAGNKLNIKKINISPLSTEIEISGEETKNFKYFVFDDKGNLLKLTGLKIHEDNTNHDLDSSVFNYCSLIDMNTKSLTFLPYKEKECSINSNTSPLEVSQEDLEKLSFSDFKFSIELK